VQTFIMAYHAQVLRALLNYAGGS